MLYTETVCKALVGPAAVPGNAASHPRRERVAAPPCEICSAQMPPDPEGRCVGGDGRTKPTRLLRAKPRVVLSGERCSMSVSSDATSTVSISLSACTRNAQALVCVSSPGQALHIRPGLTQRAGASVRKRFSYTETFRLWVPDICPPWRRAATGPCCRRRRPRSAAPLHPQRS